MLPFTSTARYVITSPVTIMTGPLYRWYAAPLSLYSMPATLTLSVADSVTLIPPVTRVMVADVTGASLSVKSNVDPQATLAASACPVTDGWK